MMTAKVLMVQGTMSSAGKSILVAGLCRIFARRGLRVAPFKAQNMSNNAAVCADGSEIGRAQYTQALACGIDPTPTMNPVLLKPEADSRSQVVVMGRPQESLPAREYYQRIAYLWEIVTTALDDLRSQYDLVIIEGAGSAAEINLKRGDIVNMAIAKYAQAPVLLAGDIDRGGIFAQLLGSLWLLEPDELALVKGLLVNKFRGDITLFYDGVQILEEKGGVPVLGVIPYIYHNLPEEDAVAIEAQNIEESIVDKIDIVVLRLPRISNFDDFDPLALEPGVSVRYVDTVAAWGQPDAVIIPGTKSTLADLAFLRERGLDRAIQDFAEGGGAVVGICGGYQMIGQHISDPDGVESSVTESPGLGLLPLTTVFAGDKATHQAQAVIRGGADWLADLAGQTVSGYEIHMGRSSGPDAHPWLDIVERSSGAVAVQDGAISSTGRVWGCYLHGLFENDAFRQAWLRSLGWQCDALASFQARLDASFDHLADELEKSLDMDRLDAIVGL